MHLFLKLFILVKRSTCFGGLSVHHQELETGHTATGIYVKLTLQGWVKLVMNVYIAAAGMYI